METQRVCVVIFLDLCVNGCTYQRGRGLQEWVWLCCISDASL